MQQFNSTFASFLVPFILFALMSCEIVSTSMSMQYGSLLISQPILLVLPYLAGAAPTFMLGWGYVAGQIYEQSRGLLEWCKTSIGNGNRRNKLRTWRHLAALKLKFGSNFMEMSTPLVMMNLISSGIVQWLLIFGNLT